LSKAGFSGSAFADDEEFGFEEIGGLVWVAGGEVVFENRFCGGTLGCFSYGSVRI
jgi:hypothetical protein